MTTTLRCSFAARLGWTWDDRVGASLITDSNRLDFDKSLAEGPGVDQADAVWHVEEQALAAGQSTTLELDALEQSRFGDTILVSLSRVKAILIVNRSTDSGRYLLVGGAPVDEWHAPFGAPGDTVKVMPDSPLLLANGREGWEVALGNTALKLAAVGGHIGYDVAILGTLAGEAGSSSSCDY